MKWWKVGIMALLAALAIGCGSRQAAITVTVTPSTVTVVVNGTQQFVAIVTGTDDTAVTWLVEDVEGGNAEVGTITTGGLYTAPPTLPSATDKEITIEARLQSRSDITGTATVTLDSGIRVQISPRNNLIGTGETLQFVATVTGTTNTDVKWTVTDVEGGNATLGTITTTGLYTAPATVPSPPNVSIRATSRADESQFDATALSIATAEDPVLDSLNPTTIAQGAVFQDIYLSGSNFLSTTLVRVDGAPFPSTFLGQGLITLRLPRTMLEAPATFDLLVERQNGTQSATLSTMVVASRPALISSSPDSATEGDPAVNVQFIGGFYTPSVSAKFNGDPKAPALSLDAPTRKLDVPLAGTDLDDAGLFSISVHNPVAAGLMAAANLAVQPGSAGLPSSSSTVGVGTQPVAVAVNTATGVAVVVNQGSNSVSIINLTTLAVTEVAVGTTPTGVAVDNERNVALVVNSGDKTVSVVDLGTGTVVATVAVPPLNAGDAAPTPFAVGVNPLSGLALVAHQTTNFASVFDLATNTFLGHVGGGPTTTVSTGTNPVVAVEPSLDWALVTPGGAGTVTIVDLARRSVVATLQLGLDTRGASISTETLRALMTNPAISNVSLFSLLDQTVVSLPLEEGHVASAVNPLTDIGVTVNPTTDMVSVIDLRTPSRVATLAAGTDPRAVAIDPGSNRAVVVNEGSDNVTILGLGAIRAMHITQVSPRLASTSSADLTLSLVGHGFEAGAVVRLDETALATTFVNSRRLTAVVPAAMLAAPRRFALDVMNPGGTLSNVSDLAVQQIVAVGAAPRAVAIDAERNIAAVTNSASNTVSIVDLATGTVTETFDVGTDPQGVAFLSRTGQVIVANRGSNNASIIDLSDGTVDTVPVGSQPVGVAVNPHTGIALVTNSGANSVSFIGMAAGTVESTVTVDQGPAAVAIAPERGLAVVVNAQQNTAVLLELEGGSGTLINRNGGFNLPTGAAYDPVSDRFLVVSSLANNLGVLDPDTFVLTPLRVGINPTSLALNPHSSTLVTVNTASRTVSVMDFLGRRVRAVFGFDGSQRFSVDIHPRSNLAVLVDEGQDRVVLFPLPH